MTAKSIVNILTYLEPVLCAMVVILLVRTREYRKFGFLTALLSIRTISSAICLSLLYFGGHGIEKHFAYHTYFYVYWCSYAADAILSLMLVYSVFRLAMAPLKGLQTLGMLIFRWVGAISIAVAIGVAVNPHVTGIEFMRAIVVQLRQTSSILTLCMLLFVCFAIRPMGLSYRSRIFGICLGLGVLATTSLVDTAWLARSSRLDSIGNMIDGLAICLTLLTWSAYFAFPEAKARIIVLPTTSPFLRWNQISMALGDDPGFVAVGGIPPELFAPAELEVMKRASVKMQNPAQIEQESMAAPSAKGLLSRMA
jgi:hypothetical protein